MQCSRQKTATSATKVQPVLDSARMEQPRQTFLDELSNQPKNDQTRVFFRKLLLGKFEERLNECVERMFELPAIYVLTGDYLDLLLESRQLFIEGKFYSCVAMCGI